MLVKREIERRLRGEDILPREITDHGVYVNRRAFMAGAAALALAPWGREASAQGNLQPLQATKSPVYRVQEALTPYKHVTTYNNFYEFGTNKEDPEQLQASLKTRPWTVQVDGLCAKPKTFGIEDLLKFPLEERVYRLRCVEAWSMSSRGSASRSRTCSSASSPRRRPSTSSSPRFSTRRCSRGRSAGSSVSRSTGRTRKGCASTRPCTR